jgi:hypothetical protein
MSVTANQDKRDPRQELARRNVRTALWLALVAVGFVVAFVWSVAHHHGG